MARVKTTWRLLIHIHICGSFGVESGFARLVLNTSRPWYFSIPQGGARCHEYGVVDVTGIGEDDHIEIEQPRFFASKDGQVRRVEGWMGEGLVQDGGKIMLQIVESIG